MQVALEPKQTRQIEPTAVFQQTAYWAAVKEHQGCATMAFDIRIQGEKLHIKQDTDKQPDNALDDLLVILHRVNQQHYIAYVPYGPVIEPSEDIQGQYLEELSEALRPHLPDGCIMIRYDLRWKSHWSEDEDRFDADQRWQGPPPPAIQEMRLNFSTSTRNLRKTASDHLPSNTLFIDLRKEPEQLLAGMKPKTRYNIHLAKRKGVVVEKVDDERLPVWYDLYRQTAERNGVYLHDFSYFQTVLAAQRAPRPFKANVELLLARAGDLPLAAMFLATSGGRATYLYGASASHHRNYMGSYALQWAAMNKAKEKGCTEYDMFGIAQPATPSHPLYGLNRFKSGFGGYIYHRMGCWDYPLIPAEYETYRAAELNHQGYHTNGHS